jgi:hypothetical protein
VRASLIQTATVNGYCRMLRENDCVVDRDDEAGTVVAKDGDAVVFKAIQKGRGQPWIASFHDSDRIQWSN